MLVLHANKRTYTYTYLLAQRWFAWTYTHCTLLLLTAVVLYTACTLALYNTLHRLKTSRAYGTPFVTKIFVLCRHVVAYNGPL